MIELRWKIDPLVKCDPADNGIYDVRRTLQFRTQAMQMGFGYTAHPEGGLHQYQRPMGWKWTEWQDVPEFAAGQLAASESNAAQHDEGSKK